MLCDNVIDCPKKQDDETQDFCGLRKSIRYQISPEVSYPEIF